MSLPNITMTEKSMIQAVSEAVQQQADKLREEQIKEAVGRFEAALRERLAKAVMSIHDLYSVERYGRDLRITVKLDGGSQ